jgi:hypothetical protein
MEEALLIDADAVLATAFRRAFIARTTNLGWPKLAIYFGFIGCLDRLFSCDNTGRQ